MIVDLNSQLSFATPWSPFRKGPTLQCTINFKPEVPMKARRMVFLDDVDGTGRFCCIVFRGKFIAKAVAYCHAFF